MARTEATAEQLATFGAALAVQLAGRNRAEFLAAVAERSGETVSRAALQQYLAGTHEPSRRKVAAMEEVLGVRPGALSRCLGWLPVGAAPARSVLQAIDEDPRLGEQARRLLKGNYRELAGG